jgi:hypothetical protein
VRDAYVVTGTLTDGRTVALDEGQPLGPTGVRAAIEPRPARDAGSQRPSREVVAEIRRRQTQRGRRPPARAAVDSHLRADRQRRDAVARRLVVPGGAARRVSPAARAALPGLPWPRRPRRPGRAVTRLGSAGASLGAAFGGRAGWPAATG